MPSQVNLKEQFPQTWPHYLLTFNVSPNVCVIVDFFYNFLCRSEAM